jgi:hypothetical protein
MALNCVHLLLILVKIGQKSRTLHKHIQANLDFRRDVDVICGLLGNFLLGILTREDGTDTLSRNVGK